MEQEQLDKLRAHFNDSIPFNKFLGLRTTELRPGFVRMELAFRPELIGNPAIPALHGGVISATLDTCGGAAAWSKIEVTDRVATVDLRIDYLRPGRPETLVGTGEVIRTGNRVGVVQLKAFHPGREDSPVAVGMGVYNIRRGVGGDPDDDGQHPA